MPVKERTKKGRFDTTMEGDAGNIYRTGLLKVFSGEQIQDDILDQDGNKIVQTKVTHKKLLTINLADADRKIWRIKPPSVKEFFESWFPEPLFPVQYDFAVNILGKNPLVWDGTYDEGHAFWGKGSGKDRTISKIFAYVGTKLLCMHNPQRGLSSIVGEGTLGIDSPIDIINVSKDQVQAKDVFFKNLKTILRKVRNPYTGNYFFEECGVDLREGYDVQTTAIKFPFEITFHSLNSKQFAGEGLNTFFAAADEVGSCPAANIRAQLTSIRETIDSRFPLIGKMLLMSYKYDDNCPMTTEYKMGLKEPRVYSSNYATWEVNPNKDKKNYTRHYTRDPEKAQWTYECKETGDKGGGYIKQKYSIDWAFSNRVVHNPVKGDIITSTSLRGLVFKESFWNQLKGKIISMHVDLAKGKVKSGGDCAGIGMAYPQLMKQDMPKRAFDNLRKKGLLLTEEEMARPKKGVVIPFAMQLFAEGNGEVQFNEIIDFILMVKARGINIFKVTYDGWQSIGEIQRLVERGINAEYLSVDKSTDPYDTIKELMYTGLLTGYEHKIMQRELKELVKTEKGKIDHPEFSWKRLESEGVDHGSKDVADCIAGAGYTAMKEIPLSSGIVW